MNQNATNDSREAINRRFMAVSLDNPVNYLLYRLALEKGIRSSPVGSFAQGLHEPLPDAEQFLKMKDKISLLPLDDLKDKIKLPSVPGIVLKLQNALETGASSHELSEIIRFDPKLTTAIMGLINSPLYMLPVKIETLERAIVIIGVREISALALGARLLAMFEDCAPPELPLESFFKHSIATAILARSIAQACQKADPEKYLVAGLLHDLGRIILFSRYPAMAKVAMALQQVEVKPLHEAEQELFDVDHCLVGSIFLSEWNLPQSVVQSALHHHNPGFCLGKDILEVIYVANQVSTALGIGCNQYLTEAPANDIWERLELDETVLWEIVSVSEEQFRVMLDSLKS